MEFCLLGLVATGRTGHSTLATKKCCFRTSRLENMSRSPSAFRQTDVTRAVKAVQAAGCSVVRVLIGKDGQIEVTTEPAPAKAGAEVADLDLDRELADWDGRRGR